MISRHLVRYVLTAALRDRLMMTLGLMTLVGAAVAVFMGSAAVTEANSFALVFGAGGLRLLGVTGLALFCSFYIRRSFETKEVEFLLSRPISRMSFLLSHAVAFAVLSLLVALVMAVAVALIGKPDMVGIALWTFSLVIEFSIVTVAALFFSMVLPSAAGSALATLGFYSLSRMVGVLLGIIDVAPVNWFFAILGSIMKFLAVLIPRLDMMGQTTWLIYGAKGSLGIAFMPNAGAYAESMMVHLGLTGFLFLQGVIFVALLLAAAAYDFMRREF